MKSLKAEGHRFSNSERQLQVLNDIELPKFKQKLAQNGAFPLSPQSIDIFQINLGKMCNQTCKHCHVDAGPDRKEIMKRETLEICLAILQKHPISTIDLTGGAPEMNPNFRWFVEEASTLGKKVIVRCNLTIILANKKFHDLPAFFAKHNVEVVSSMPHYTMMRTDSQRGTGVFDKSIKALQLLNDQGYGKDNPNLRLNLVYNPTGAILPGSQEALERDFKTHLKSKFNIDFNELYVITNLPISRFLDYLVASENYTEYMSKLVNAYNPSAIEGLMCRNTLSVGWDGLLYDCDFNQMLDLPIEVSTTHINDFNHSAILNRNIAVNQHCYGCTAGAGSSCGGQIV